MLPMVPRPETLSGITDLAVATGIAIAWGSVIGSAPQVVNQGDYYEIVFTPEQEDAAADFIIRQLNKTPGPVRMDAGGIATKVISRQYWLWILGIAGAGAALGYLLKGKV